MTRIFILSIIVLSTSIEAFSQKKIEYSGYLSGVGTAIKMEDTKFYNANLHQRSNVALYPYSWLTTKVEFRTQWITGEYVNDIPEYAKGFIKDGGLVPMKFNWYENKHHFMNTMVDRAYIELTFDKLEITAGRQRINWGRSLVWNPNDVFNAYSYYDFDYPEKPGSDAIKIRYYTGTASQIEAVIKADSAKRLTTMALYKFNKWNYDIQFIAGQVNESDVVFGTGWEGNVRNFGFRGEGSVYFPYEENANKEPSILVSISSDYSFSNNSMIQAEILYNDYKNIQSLSAGILFNSTPDSPKSISFSEWNIFANYSIPVSPIISASAAIMYYPDKKGFFLMPGIDISATNNISLTLSYQHFNLYEKLIDERVAIHLGFLRAKWNF